MAGQIHRLIQKIIISKSLGDPFLEKTTRLKLILKGIKVDNYNENSVDDPAVQAKLQEIASEFGVNI